MSRRFNPKVDALANARRAEDRHVTYQAAFDKMQQQIQAVEARQRIPLIKEPIQDIVDPSIVAENVPSTARAACKAPMCVDRESLDTTPFSSVRNPTVLPASFMQSLCPIIIIRHPALMIPSFYRISSDIHGARVDDEDFPVNATFRWSRLVYDYYIALQDKESPTPIVIDSSRLLGDPETVMTQCCVRAGLDPQYLQFQWPQAMEEHRGVVSAGTLAFRKDFLLSTKVKRNKDSGREPVIEEELVSWREEFGEEAAEAIARYSKAAMADYEYLRQFAL